MSKCHRDASESNLDDPNLSRDVPIRSVDTTFVSDQVDIAKSSSNKTCGLTLTSNQRLRIRCLSDWSACSFAAGVMLVLFHIFAALLALQSGHSGPEFQADFSFAARRNRTMLEYRAASYLFTTVPSRSLN